MKLLIGTPIFDQVVTVQYLYAYHNTVEHLLREQVQWGITTESRNLLSQCRNRMAHLALKGGYDKLLFIDADVIWNGSDVIKLLRSDKKIIAGAYPFKAFPIRLNIVPKLEWGLTQNFDYQTDFIDKYADPVTKEVEVFRAPTGFLMIDVSVLQDMWDHTDVYRHKDPMMTEEENEHMFFPVGIDPVSKFLNTEDWGFCDLAQKLGHKIYWHTEVVVDHVGKHTYSARVPIAQSYGKRQDLNKIQGLGGINQEPVHNPELAKTIGTQTVAPQQEIKRAHPFNNWPANLWCFCGSGKKFKKCHAGQFPPYITVNEWEILNPDFEAQLKHVQETADQGITFKLSREDEARL